MNLLNSFYTNEGQREAVKTFLIESLGEIAIEKSFRGEDTRGIKEAKECVDRAFNKLEAVYGKVDKPINSNSR